MLFPRHSGDDLQAVVINTAGGITGGDVFRTNAVARANAGLTITTQAAERAYRTEAGQTGRIENRLTISEQAHINWFPQETILFNGCALSRSLHVDMATQASFLMVEPLVFGRREMGETLTNGYFRDRIEIFRNGVVSYVDSVLFNGDIAAHLARPHVAAGAGAMVNLVYIAENAPTYLDPVRKLLQGHGGASLISEDMLLLRLLSPDSYLMRKSLIPVLNMLTKGNLPRCWMI